MDEFSWSVLIGGFVFFFYGLKGARGGLERVAGDRLKAAMSRMTGNRVIAVIFGAFVTLILQSSGATSAILISFSETGLLTLFQAAAVLLGSDIGTTFVVILLSIRKITDVALLIVAVGFFAEFLAKKRRVKDMGRIIFSFGLIFYGMSLMSQAAIPLKESEVAVRAFAYLANNPLAALILAAIMSSAIHSAATIGIAIALAFGGAISVEAAIPIVLGANIGTCFTTIIAGLASGVNGKRVALLHTLSKVIGVVIVFQFIPYFVRQIGLVDNFIGEFAEGYQAGVAAKIATAHILFNIALAVFFLPLLTPLVKLVEILIPMPPAREEKFGPKYLDKSAIETPVIAFANVRREIMRISAIAQSMFGDVLRMFSRGEDNQEAIEFISNEDDKIDVLEKAIRFYLAEISIDGLSEEQSKRFMALLTIAADLEDIGDTISHELAQLAKKKAKRHIFFSDDGWRDLRNFQGMVLENFNLMVSMLAQPDDEISKKLMRHEAHMNDIEQQLRQAHITRLHEGLRESFDTSSIHLDILSNVRRINSMLAHIAETARDLA